MNRSSFFACAAFIAAAATGFAGAEVIICETAPGGWNNDIMTTGSSNWLSSTAKSLAPGLIGRSSVFNTVDANAGTVRFTPDVPVAGEYELYVTYPVSGNSADSAVRVTVNGVASAPVVVAQDGRAQSTPAKPDSWYSVGKFKLVAGKKNTIEVIDPGSQKRAFDREPNGRVYADAIMLAPVGFVLPTIYENKVNGVPTTVAAADARNMPTVEGLRKLAAAGTGSAPSALSGRAVELASAPATAPGSSPFSSAPSALPSLGAAAGGSSGLPKPATAPGSDAPAGSLPSLGSAAGLAPGSASAKPAQGSTATPRAALPSLGSATMPALDTASAPAKPAAQDGAMPSLTAAQVPATGGAPPSALPPSMPSLGSASLPPLGVAAAPAQPAQQGGGMPSLTAAQATPAGGSAPPSMPTLGSASLPSLGAAGTPAVVSAGMPSLSAMPSLPGGTAAPSTGAATGSLPPPMVVSVPPPSMPSLGAPGASLSTNAKPSAGTNSSAGQLASASANLSRIPAQASPSGSPFESSSVGSASGGQSALGSVPEAAVYTNRDVNLRQATDPNGLPWKYDLRSAQESARSQKQDVLVFFTAKGNRKAAEFEQEFFSSDSVRRELSKYILVKIDFPTNTKLAYQHATFGSGKFVILTADGTKKLTVDGDRVSSADDLVSQLKGSAPSALPAGKQMASAGKPGGVPSLPAAPGLATSPLVTPSAPSLPGLGGLAPAAAPAKPGAATATGTPAAPAVPALPSLPGAAKTPAAPAAPAAGGPPALPALPAI